MLNKVVRRLKRPIGILGAGGHALSVAETAISAGFRVVFFVREGPGLGDLLGIPILRSVPEDFIRRRGAIAIAVGDNSKREEWCLRVLRKFPDANFPTLIHASASVSRYATIGQGSVVMQGGIVGTASSVGAFCIVNSGSSLDHNSSMADYSSLAPLAALGGGTSIGVRSAISMGAMVLHNVKVGSDAVIGASSLVNCDIPARVVAHGTPARLVRGRSAGDPYLS